MRRRDMLKVLGGAALALPFYELLIGSPSARAAAGQARRVIFFYFPDGIPGASQNGERSLWHCQGSERDFSLSECLGPLGRRRDDCVFFNGLSMGGTDAGSHPGGAKKLLTGVDGGGGESIDRFLARTFGAQDPHRMIYLGAMANHNGASGDKHVSYDGPGHTIAPEDNPMRAFERIFGQAPAPGSGGGQAPQAAPSTRATVIDGVLAEMHDLRARLGQVDKARLDAHLESLREVEQRIKANNVNNPPPVQDTRCDQWRLDPSGLNEGVLYDPGHFPTALKLQIDLMVQAMACGLTRVGTLQASHHTSELIMSRFADSEMYDPGYDMRSHQASHYGASHNRGHREFRDFVLQRRWFVAQFTYLLDQLAQRPEGDGSMLDHSLVWLCTEVSDGNTHLHDDMPFVLGGRAGGAINTGRLLQYGWRPHSDLLVSIAQAAGQNIQNFGWNSSGGLPGLLA